MNGRDDQHAEETGFQASHVTLYVLSHMRNLVTHKFVSNHIYEALLHDVPNSMV